MQEVRDGFHEVLRHLHRLTISSSALLKIAEKQQYEELHEKEHMKKTLETVVKSCELAKDISREVDKLRDTVYTRLNIEI